MRREWSLAQAADYLVGIESEHMGLGIGAMARPRAEATVAAIKAYLLDP